MFVGMNIDLEAQPSRFEIGPLPDIYLDTSLQSISYTLETVTSVKICRLDQTFGLVPIVNGQWMSKELSIQESIGI